MAGVDEILRRAANPQQGGGFERIRLGRGVVGNTASVMIAAVLASGGIAYALQDNPWVAALVVGAILIFAYVYTRDAWNFANKNPDLAVLDGAEFVRAREIEMAAKGIDRIPVMAPVIDPTHAPKSIEGAE